MHTVDIEGEFVNHDKEFIYIKKPGAKKIIKLPRRYALNSPTNIPKKFKMRFQVPIYEFLIANEKIDLDTNYKSGRAKKNPK